MIMIGIAAVRTRVQQQSVDVGALRRSETGIPIDAMGLPPCLAFLGVVHVLGRSYGVQDSQLLVVIDVVGTLLFEESRIIIVVVAILLLFSLLSREIKVESVPEFSLDRIAFWVV